MIQKVAADDESLIIPEGLTAKLLPWLASGLPMSNHQANVNSGEQNYFHHI
jgi:hypothetical protein